MLLACLLAGASSGAVRGFCSPASGHGPYNQLAVLTAAMLGLPAQAFVHQRPCVQAPSQTPVLQLPPSSLRPPRPRPSPVPSVPPQAGRCCLPRVCSGHAPAARLPPPCEGGTGLAALASLSGGRNFCWGILAETEVFGFFIPSWNAGNPSPAAHPAVDLSDVLRLLLLLWGRVLGSTVDFFFFFLAQTGKCPPCWKAIVVPCQGLNARSPVYCRRTSPGTGGLLAGKVLAQPFSPWSAVTKESAQASGATTMNIKYVRKCRMAVHFWWIQTPLDVPAGLERRFYLKLPCGFTARGRLESTSARSAYGAALTLTPPLLTWALGRTRLCSSRWFFNYRAQKRALDLFAGSKGSVGHYPITWEGSK